MYSRALIPILGLLMPMAVLAQTIYKCPQPDGRYAYADVPCTGAGGQVVGKPKAEPAVPAEPSTDQLSAMSLADIHTRFVALADRRRQLQADQQRDSDETAARLNIRAKDDPSIAAEVAQLKETWLPKIQAVDDQMEVLKQEIRRRCPHGSALSPNSKSCGKRIGPILTPDTAR